MVRSIRCGAFSREIAVDDGEASVGFSADGFAPPRAIHPPYLTALEDVDPEADNGLNTGLKSDET